MAVVTAAVMVAAVTEAVAISPYRKRSDIESAPMSSTLFSPRAASLKYRRWPRGPATKSSRPGTRRKNERGYTRRSGRSLPPRSGAR